MTQQEALDILKTGANVFLTGEPGSGKTHAINRYVEYLRGYGIEPAITASTGVAATHINGMTIHSWSGIGIHRALSKDDLETLSARKRLISRFSRTRILIIDEVSMLDAQTVDSIEAVCRKLKRNGMPWGGMQIVFAGDFFQLPPIAREGEEPPKFAFLSSAWQKANPLVCYLSGQYRQSDGKFLFTLASIRRGDITDEVRAAISSREIKTKGIEKNFTRLYSHNADVDRVNNEKLNALPGEETIFTMESRGPEELVRQLKRGCLSPEMLRLKVGAKVMFTKNNFEQGFVNGTIGELESFSEEGFPIVRTHRGRLIEVSAMEWSVMDGVRTLAKIFQLPLRLAWAITVHKSQGMTLDSAVVDLSEAFEYGQGYVALSRVQTSEGLYLLGYNKKSLEVHPDVLEIDLEFKKQSRAALEKFSEAPLAERIQKEKKFIVACGGKTEKALKKTRKKFSPAARGESTFDKTLVLWKQGKGVEDIARARALAKSTIISHLEELFMQGKIGVGEFRKLATPKLLEDLPKINSTFKELGITKLSPVFQKLDGAYSYEDLRLARIILSDK